MEPCQTNPAKTGAGIGTSGLAADRNGGEPGIGTILVVDDEPGVRHLCRMVLQRAGYDVLEADSADSAREVWLARSGGVDLLLTDYNMPGPTGLDLCQWLHAESPQLRVVLMSGGPTDNLPFPAFVTFLPKPFTIQTLTETVRCQLKKP